MTHGSQFATRYSLLVLSFLGAFLIGVSAPRAQVAYNFQTPDQVQFWGSPGAGPGYNTLTMDCLAANGYGIWTSSYSVTDENNEASCYLLGNKLFQMPIPPNPLLTMDDPQSGVLGVGTFNFTGSDSYPISDAIKCAANLKGNVRYVWMNNDRNAFYVEGFDPGTPGGSTGIDISMKSCPSNFSILKSSSAAGWIGLNLLPGHNVVSSSDEYYAFDRFDIAIDASNLYIVWEEKVDGNYTVWGAVVGVGGGLMMAPTQITPEGGRRPTVAADVRNLGSMMFDVACLSVSVGSEIIDDTSHVWWIQYNGASHRNTRTKTRARHCPVEEGAYYPVIDNPIWAFADPYEGLNSALPATADFTEFHCLYQLARTDGTNYPTSNNPLMIIPGSNAANGFCVSGYLSFGIWPAFYEDPDPESAYGSPSYCGAVNQMGIHVYWYGQTDETQYYRRDKREFNQNIEENTLMTDTCVIGNTESFVAGNPSDLLGESNPIVLSNNFLTLYSDPNDPVVSPLISSGSFSPSVGWLDFDDGATLNIGSTSPTTNTGADFVISGCTGISVLGQLPGLANPSALPGACMGNSWTINFAADNAMDYYGAPPNVPPQTFVLSIQLYGGNPPQQFFGNGQINLTGTGETLVSNGTTSGQVVYSITDPVTWTIHNTFLNLMPCDALSNDADITATNINITATDGIFNFIGNSSGTYPSSIQTFCNASFTNCEFTSLTTDHIHGYALQINGYGTWDPQVTCTGTGDGNINATSYPSPESHLVTLTNCYSELGIDVEGFSVPPAAVTVSGGRFLDGGIAVDVFDDFAPWWPISITNADFTQMFGNGIEINLLHYPDQIFRCVPGQLYSILIDHNNFEFLAWPTDLTGFTTYSSPIFIIGQQPAPIGASATITVSNNTIAPSYASWESLYEFDAGIHFSSATGNITGNVFNPAPSGSSTVIGIWNESTTTEDYGKVMTTNFPTSTFICSNTVLGCTNVGISTDNWTGYEKLNAVDGCLTAGHLCGINDDGHIDFSNFTDNYGPGVQGTEGAKIDMTGVHLADTTRDDPAMNTISYSNDYTGQAIELDQVPGGDPETDVWLGQAPPGSSHALVHYGQNSIQGSPDILSTSLIGPYDIGNNYWFGSSPHTTDYAFTQEDPALSSAVTPSGFECGTLLTDAKAKTAKPLAIQTNDTSSHCDSLVYVAYVDIDEMPQQWQNGYDTVQLFLEQCPYYKNADGYFNEEGIAAQQLVNENELTWDQQLSWLKSVLYLNLDSGWYCEDVVDIIRAVQIDSNEGSSVLQYIYNSGKCPYLDFEFTDIWTTRHTLWLDSLERKYGYTYGGDTVAAKDSINADTLAHPFVVTEFPPVTQIGLSILLGPQYAVVGTPVTNTTQALLSAQLMENPTSMDEIGVSFQMGRTALVSMQLRDILGRLIPITNAQYNLQSPGTHEATIPVPNLPSGTYYLRLSTDAGDAITLKVVKE